MPRKKSYPQEHECIQCERVTLVTRFRGEPWCSACLNPTPTAQYMADERERATSGQSHLASMIGYKYGERGRPRAPRRKGNVGPSNKVSRQTEIGKALSSARIKMGLTLAQAALECGITKDALYQAEMGSTWPHKKTRDKITNTLGLDAGIFERM